ncbi:MAG: phosphoglucosamine mutase [Candidatus Micrarchaeota archaeon]
MFGTSGIRGVFGKDVTVGLALEVGQAIGGKGKTLFIGRDTRPSGIALENALASGALSSGADVVRIGIAPTPTTSYASRSSLGAMITASHNPPEYNGIKLFEEGEEIAREKERGIEKALGEKRWEFKGLGKERYISTAIREHSELVLSRVDIELIEKRKPKVLVDAGNGAGGVIMPYVLRRAGCKVVALNCEPTGFFARNLEPNAQNLEETAKVARSIGADLAIAHDGDADRAIILDEKGEMLGLDSQLALMCSDVLSKKKGVVVTTVEASLAIREAIESSGGKTLITKVGSLHVGEALKKAGGVFGGEPCGEYIFPGNHLVPDGIMAGLRFVELFCESGSLGDAAGKIKKYPMKRAKYPCKDKLKAMEKILERAKELGGKQSTGDGVRVDFEDSWVLIRASGTEPIIRITCEHKDKKGLEALFSRAEKIVLGSV